MGFILSLVCLIYSQFLHRRNEGFEFKMVHCQQNEIVLFILAHVLCILYYFYYYQHMHNNITTVSLCNIQGVPGGMCQTSGECS
jgi:lipoprotein signal peptidase